MAETDVINNDYVNGEDETYDLQTFSSATTVDQIRTFWTQNFNEWTFEQLKKAVEDGGLAGQKGDKGDKGDQGDPGADGATITSITFTSLTGTTDGSTFTITAGSGTANLSNSTTAPITVS